MDPARAAERAAELGGLFPQATVTAHAPAELGDIMPLADGLVHCTPIGMAAHPGLPLDIELLEPRQWVADIVYRPIETQLVREARAKGCDVLDGGRMAVGQAADAFHLITGREADRERMRAHFLELIAVEDAAASLTPELTKAGH
ncbi:Quinate/shikimate dehydrogenase [compost metagenome]